MFKYKLALILCRFNNWVANRTLEVDTNDEVFMNDEDAVYSLGLEILKYGKRHAASTSPSEVIATKLIERLIQHQKQD